MSFTAGTRVLLASGETSPISGLKPGDKVQATSTSTGRTSPEAVAAVEVHHDTNLYNLTVKTGHGTEVIHTTANHLFWGLLFNINGSYRTNYRKVSTSRPPTAALPSPTAARCQRPTMGGCGTSPSPAITTTTST
jgi:hypothetical protein